MKIIIHRGINQIGGCITEIATENTRILIDLGENLPDNEGNKNDNLANINTVNQITQDIDAIFYTHYHEDHLGLFHYLNTNTPQYIGKIAKQIMLCKYHQLSYIKGNEHQSQEDILKLNLMNELSSNQKIIIGDITITPYFVSHSAYDAFMFLIEAEGKRILHTGDFRGHGYLSKGLIPTIKNYILPKGEIHYLITEGTMISRNGEKVMTENELKNEAIQLLKSYKYVFVICSSTDLERLATFYAANKSINYKPFICDRYQKNILEIFTNTAGNYSSLFSFNKVFNFSPTNVKLLNLMSDNGFCMLVRPTDKFRSYYDLIKPRFDPNDTVIIFSMWKEYINNNGKHAIQRYVNFLDMFQNIRQLHTSGHASPEYLAEICNLVNPTMGIIPIHSENSEDYKKLPINENLLSKILTTSTIKKDVAISIFNQ